MILSKKLKYSSESFGELDMSLTGAIESRNFELAKKLIREGTDTEERNAYHQTALLLAAGIGNIELIELLVSHDADIEAVADYGHRPLMHAASNRSYWKQDNVCEQTVTFFLKYGPIIDAQDNYGWTALHHATYDGHVLTVKRLLAAGADLKIRNKKGENPLTLAVKRPQQDPYNERATIKPDRKEEDSMFNMVKVLLEAENKLGLHWKRRRSLHALALIHRCPEAAALFT